MSEFMHNREPQLASRYLDIMNMTNYVTGTFFNDTTGNATYAGNSSAEEKIMAVFSQPTGCDDGSDFLRWFGDVVITPPLITFGVIGNMLSFIVLCIQKPYLTTSILLSYLAIVDTLILLAAIPLRVVRQVQVCHDVLEDYHDIYSLYIFRWGYPCMYVLRLAGTWLTTVLTVDRHIAVSKPLHAQRLVTKELAIGQIIGVTVSAILLSLPTFFEFTFISLDNYTIFQHRPFATTVWYVIGYKVIFCFLVWYIIPIAIMVIFNRRLFMKLRVAAKNRAVLQRSVSSESARLNNGVTTIVMAVVVTFLLCNTLPLIAHTLWSFEKCFPDLAPRLVHPRRYISTISNVFVTVNSAVNFLIYCVCSRSFRTTFKRQFMCGTKSETLRQAQARQSNGSATTNLSLLSNGSNKKVNGGSRESTKYLLSKEIVNQNKHKHETVFNVNS